jgi:glycine cleavage system H protein
VNQDPYGQGWIFRLRPNDVKDLHKLLEAKAYAAEIAAEEEE